MKKIVPIAIAFLAVFLIAGLSGSDFTYVGAAKCKICHKTAKQGEQFPKWETSKHSKSFASLSSPNAAAKAQEMGVTDPTCDPKCLKCHGPLHDKAPELKEEGMTCEVCHGPGSAYKKLSVMKSREESVKNGLTVYDTDETRKPWCSSCHENAHGTPFDYQAAWDQIKHPVPEK